VPTIPTHLPAQAAGTYDLGGDLTINRLGYGSIQLTGPGYWGDPKDPDEAVRVLRRAVELGVNFIDTADSYGPAVAEQLIHRALAPYPDGLVIATKVGLTRPGPDVWLPVGRPEYLRQQVETAGEIATIVSVQNLFNLADRTAEPLLDHSAAPRSSTVWTCQRPTPVPVRSDGA
jgi:aryl-alcohol dehydrogenase-like predicted oxidoreductase